MELLTIAFYLSVLSYYLGVLIYMLPIPFFGVKKWAPQLMIDGIFSAILIFSYKLLLWLIGYISNIIGADWTQYNTWLQDETTALLSMIITLKAIGVSLSALGLQFLASGFISPLISTLTYLLIFILTFSMLVVMILILSPNLLALGIMLHAAPFRITRSSGAVLISIVMVFSIATPLMPSFINLLTTPIGMVNDYRYGILRANIYLVDSFNHTVPYALFEARSNEKLLARYQADDNGYINASSIDTGIPLIRFKLNITLAGYYYLDYFDPRNHTSLGISSPPNITIRLPRIAIINTLQLVILQDCSYELISRGDNWIHLSVNGYEPYIYVVVPEGNTITFTVDGTARQPINTYSYIWGGARFKAHEYILEEGSHNVKIYVYGSPSQIPSFDEVRYAADTLGLNSNNPYGYIDPVVYYIYRLLIAPVIYISILLSASLALSKILGGSSTRLARIVVTGI